MWALTECDGNAVAPENPKCKDKQPGEKSITEGSCRGIMPSASVSIPEGALPDLKRVAELDDELFNSLLTAIGETAPTLTRDQFFTKLSDRVKSPSEDIYAVLRTAFALYTIKEKAGFSDQDLSEAVTNSSTVSEAADFSLEQREKLRNRLALLLGFDQSLGVSIKALDVMTEHERIFCTARILSDIRPVFTNELESASAMIIHTLQIGFHQDGKHREYYFALDTDDIQKLKSVIERAERKTAALQSILQRAEVRYLEV